MNVESNSFKILNIIIPFNTSEFQMTSPLSRRKFLTTTGTIAAGVSSTSMESFSEEIHLVEFKYGVASGDPLRDSVIIWTHAKFLNSEKPVPLIWQVSTDNGFQNIVNSGKIKAVNKTGFTAKVDVDGLNANSSYFYRFIYKDGISSEIGKTRTLPDTNSTDTIKIAFFSCSLYSAGYFNCYDHASNSDAQFSVHLGDYIYEYGSDPAEYGNSTGKKINRLIKPGKNIVTLQDYRVRYALYRSDKSLQALHAKMPWITVWDDHEFANNAFLTGAENHDPSRQGDWQTRKNIAARVYHEWMPIRTPDPKNLLKIYRKFDFGSVFSLHMLDTRIDGRTQQYAHFGDIEGEYKYEDYLDGLTTKINGIPKDVLRTLISPEQMNWLKEGLTNSNTTWQIVGNQIIMAKLWMPTSVLKSLGEYIANPKDLTNKDLLMSSINDYLNAKAINLSSPSSLTKVQKDLLDLSSNPHLPFNLDAWDGYPMSRETILQTAKSAKNNLIVISGDSHNAWFNTLTTLNGEKVGYEFAGTSVSSPGLETVGMGDFAPLIDGTVLNTKLGSNASGVGLGLINDVNYANTKNRGYLKLTVNKETLSGDFIYVNNVLSKNYTGSIGKTITITSTGKVNYS